MQMELQEVHQILTSFVFCLLVIQMRSQNLELPRWS